MITGGRKVAFFYGYYRHYCYLPLYAFYDDIPLWAQLRKADRDGSQGTLDAHKLIVAQIRKRHGKKAAITSRKINPRFIVTDLSGEEEWIDNATTFPGLYTVVQRLPDGRCFRQSTYHNLLQAASG